jgi:hypothetical protein
MYKVDMAFVLQGPGSSVATTNKTACQIPIANLTTVLTFSVTPQIPGIDQNSNTSMFISRVS